MKVIIFLGPPGSGKGTQANLLAQSFNAPLIGMGDLLRHEISAQTEIGRQIQPLVEAGEIPSWQLVKSIFNARLATIKDPLVIFDGVPRNQTQVLDIEKTLSSHQDSILQAFFLDVPSEVLIYRMMNRYQCLECGESLIRDPASHQPQICPVCHSARLQRRSDDQEEVIKNRLKVFRETIDPLIAHYKAQGLLTLIDGTLPVASVREQVESKIQSLLDPAPSAP